MLAVSSVGDRDPMACFILCTGARQGRNPDPGRVYFAAADGGGVPLWRAPSLSNVSKSHEGEAIAERLTEECGACAVVPWLIRRRICSLGCSLILSILPASGGNAQPPRSCGRGLGPGT